jgi:hypothetical protein
MALWLRNYRPTSLPARPGTTTAERLAHVETPVATVDG